MTIPYGKQDITEEDIRSVISVLSSEYLTQGPMVPRLEETFSELVGCKHAIAVNSATSALHVACLALNLGIGDFLWTTPISFVASANCGVYCGASIDFVDIDPNTNNISISSLEIKLKEAKKQDRLPKILVVVHFCGHPCELAEISRLSLLYGFHILEDASHAIGGKYRDDYIGSCKYSEITVFSLHAVKVITSGEGGLATTNDANLAKKMALLRSHGIIKDQNYMLKPSQGSWYYEQHLLGFNYRMTDIQAALGLSQLARLNEYVAKRNELAKHYNFLLSKMPVVISKPNIQDYSGFHLYVIRLKLDEIRKTRKQVFDYLKKNEIGVNVHYIPIHIQPYYQRMGFEIGNFPEAERYYEEAITLPLYPQLSIEQVNKIVGVLMDAIA